MRDNQDVCVQINRKKRCWQYGLSLFSNEPLILLWLQESLALLVPNLIVLAIAIVGAIHAVCASTIYLATISKHDYWLVWLTICSWIGKLQWSSKNLKKLSL